jgi:repressor LexA
MNFCENLKKSRQRVGLTQQQIANALGITKSTYCCYETGKRQPDLAKLRRLALLLCTSVDELLGLVDSENEYTVSPAEFEQIKLYRLMDAHGQRMVRVILEEESNRMHTQMREAVLHVPESHFIPLRIAKQAVTCESSAYLGPDGFALLRVRREAVPSSVSYALYVRGSSLLPRYKERDILLVSEGKPQHGEIGVFLRDGLGFIRLMGYSELLSINPAYPPIPLDESIRPCGTIIGTLSADDIL